MIHNPPPTYPFHPNLEPQFSPTRNLLLKHIVRIPVKTPPGRPFGFRARGRERGILELVHNPLDPIQAHLQRVHLRSVAEPHKVVTRTVEQIAPLARVEIEEDAGHDDDLLFQARLEEVEAVADGVGHALEIQPQVEGRIGHRLDGESHLL